MTKMYLVTDDGWHLRCGSTIYFIGVFDNLEDAQKANGKITEVELNKTYQIDFFLDEYGNERIL